MYINAIGAVSPQKTFDNEKFLEEVIRHESSEIPCLEPDYKTLLNPRRLRRMSRVIRMGMYAAKLCLAESEVEMPDAILVGTGLGCLEDTEKFLEVIYESEEGLVTPTQFIQSTHNTVSSAIALMLKCYNYNFTYVHRGFSFESTILDALLRVEEQGSGNVLIGGIDELTDTMLYVTRQMRMWNFNGGQDEDFIKFSQQGNLPGEGAAFFMLGSAKSPNAYAKIKGLHTLYKAAPEKVEKEIPAFLQKYGLTMEDIDVVCLGLNGNGKKDAIYHHLQETIFQDSCLTYFKHLCGEYKTATSFALWMNAQMLKKQQIPEVIKYGTFERENVRRVLIYNNYSNINHSMYLLEKVD